MFTLSEANLGRIFDEFALFRIPSKLALRGGQNLNRVWEMFLDALIDSYTDFGGHTRLGWPAVCVCATCHLRYERFY